MSVKKTGSNIKHIEMKGNFETASKIVSQVPSKLDDGIPCLAGFKRIIAGPNVASAAKAAVRSQIEALITAEGIRLAESLPEKVLNCLNDAIQFYREAGCSKAALDGMRLCVAQTLVEKLKA